MPHMRWEGEEGWTVCQPPCTCKWWRPWWFKWNYVREGRACARPRTDSGGVITVQDTTKLQAYPPICFVTIQFDTWAEHWLAPCLAEILILGNKAGSRLPPKGRTLSVDWRWIYHPTQWKRRREFPRIMVISVSWRPKIARAIIRTTIPVQRQNGQGKSIHNMPSFVKRTSSKKVKA